MAIGLVFASALGALLSIASHTWDWSASAVFWAGMAMAALLGFVVTPLVVIPIGIRCEDGKLRLRVSSTRTRR